MTKHYTMEYEQWVEQYKPMINYIDPDSSFDQTMFETYGDEVEHVCDRSITPDTEHTVWTYIDGDGGTYIINGYHLVNRIGYFITEKPAEADATYEIVVSQDAGDGQTYIYDEGNIEDLLSDDVVPIGADISYSYVDELANKRCGYVSFGTHDEETNTDSFGVDDNSICFYFENVQELLDTVKRPQEFVIHNYEIYAKDKHGQHAHSQS